MLDLSATALARLIAARKLSSLELISSQLRALGEINPALNAAVALFADEALAEARQADARLARGELCGSLHGVPFSVKDSIDVRGHTTTAGTLGYRHRPPAAEDAVLVARLRAAGAIPICKTNLPDLLFAYESDNLIYGRTNNPYDLHRTPGGSSGGESALIAACGSPLGLGSDAAGSVRVPAAFCGITSLKPTSGRLPRTGHVPPPGGWIEALWQIGPMARHVEDLTTVLPLLASPDGGFDPWCPPAALDSAPASVKGLRIACFTANGFARCSQPVIHTVQLAARALADAGANVEHATPPGMDAAYDLEMRLLGVDGGQSFDAFLLAIGSTDQHALLHAGFLNRMRHLGCSPGELAALWARWDQYRFDLARFFQQYDAVLSPVYTCSALRHGESAHEEQFRGFSYTMAWNVGGNPAATVRCGTDAGLPLNVQVITPRWHDMRALAICAELETRLGGWQAPSLQRSA